MAEKSCWTCFRFPECDRVRSKGRKYRLWNAPHRFNDFYRQTADNCHGWTEDSIAAARMAANELLWRVDAALKAGKIVALENGTGSFHFYGEYDDENCARNSVNGNGNILLLKTLSG